MQMKKTELLSKKQFTGICLVKGAQENYSRNPGLYVKAATSRYFIRYLISRLACNEQGARIGSFLAYYMGMMRTMSWLLY